MQSQPENQRHERSRDKRKPLSRPLQFSEKPNAGIRFKRENQDQEEADRDGDVSKVLERTPEGPGVQEEVEESQLQPHAGEEPQEHIQAEIQLRQENHDKHQRVPRPAPAMQELMADTGHPECDHENHEINQQAENPVCLSLMPANPQGKPAANVQAKPGDGKDPPCRDFRHPLRPF